MSTVDRPGPAGPPRGVQWAAIDWCARQRPAIWLQAADLVSDADELWCQRPVDGVAELEAVWWLVARSAAAALAARQACSQELGTAAREHHGPEGADVLSGMASLAWPSAIGAAGHLVARAARVAGLPDPGRAVFRTFTLPDGAGTGWDQAWDLARDAACVVTFRVDRELLSTQPATWTAAGPEKWATAQHAVRQALAPVRAELTESAAGWMERAS